MNNLFNPRPRKEHQEDSPGRPVCIDGVWRIEWTPARPGHAAITPYGWPTREQAEKVIGYHADEIAAEIDGITDQIKNHMDAAQVDTLSGNDWKVTYKAVTSSRLDTSALKKALPDIAAQYTKTTTARRFLLA